MDAAVFLTRPETGAGGVRALRTGGAILVLGAVLGGCEAPFEVEAPERFDPPTSYHRWWVELEVCVGLEREFGRIRWYAGESIVVEDKPAYGVWVAPDMIIMERFYVTSETAVKHEMLHHLSRGSLPHHHPDFTRCTAAAPPDSLGTWAVDPAIGGR